jgi:hypothetical protein
MPYKDPSKRRAYQRDHARARRAGESNPRLSLVPAPFRLKTALDVLSLLEEQVAAVRATAECSTLERARCLGFLAGVALRAVEVGELANRLEALEGALKARQLGGGSR